MSRSIHSTHRDYRHELNADYADSGRKRVRVNRIREEISKKRAIKKQVRGQRGNSKRELLREQGVGQDPDSIPIIVQGSGSTVHFPLSAYDVRGLLKFLPHDLTNGLESIHFCLGAEYQNERSDSDYDKDPLTGRLGSELVPGVYVPPFLGTYWPDACRIDIYAYVWEQIPEPARELSIFLKLTMLSTLLHELAHHDDNMRRKGRGRWLGLNKGKAENYAEVTEFQWMRAAGEPFVLEVYPDECRDLLSWMRDYGGLEAPLHELISDPRPTWSGDYQLMIFTIASAVQSLFEDAFEQIPVIEARTNLAWELHYGDHDDYAREVLDSILKINPRHAASYGIISHLCCDAGEWELAEVAARKALSRDSKDLEALDSLCCVSANNGNREDHLKYAELGIAFSESGSWKHKWFLEEKVRACLFLGKIDESIKTIDLLSEKNLRDAQMKASLRALALLLNQDVAEATKIARDLISAGKTILPAKAIAKLILIESKSDFTKGVELSEIENAIIVGFGYRELLQ